MKIKKYTWSWQSKFKLQQECIPVGCVPPACCQYLSACTAPGGGSTCPGGYLLGWGLGGVPVWGGCTSPGGVPARGCTCPGGVPAQEGCTCLGGYLPRRACTYQGVPVRGVGVYLPRGWGVPAQVPPPHHCKQNSRCKNITLPQTSFAGGNKASLVVVTN